MIAGTTHAESGLSKTVWSDADFDEMEWHQVTIHGLCVQPGAADGALPRLMLDIDYIIRWVYPVEPEKHFTFWISPATLVFEDVRDVVGDLSFTGLPLSLDIDQLRRADPQDGEDAPHWHIEGQSFDLRFRASGFRQYLRQVPQHSPRLVLAPDARGGIAFTETAFA
ncbi:hypothetical protein [Kitasatospora terrestris]|uniref:Uncharacterized protein n=1 Tax=Kitasatospora terrestris TaxID=258051 RepID=A0ABP9D729_9ACTN